MKRTIAFMMALALCVGTTATAFAEDTATEFSFTLRNDPTYTVTIPAQVTIEKDGTDVEVVAEDVENLAENEKISVTIAGTDYFRNQMVLDRQGYPRGDALSDRHPGRPHLGDHRHGHHDRPGDRFLHG